MLAVLAVFLFNLALFLLPGFAVAVLLNSRRALSAISALITVIAASSTFGYVSFWIFFAATLAGKLFSFALMAASLFILIRHLRSPGIKILARAIAPPIAYTAAAGLLYLCWFFLFSNPFHSAVDLANFRFFTAERPGDNVIPYIFAQKIYSHEPLHPFCCGDWLSSDRPPLQAGVYLYERPLRLVEPGLSAQLTGVALQCLWTCGVWALLTSLGATPQRIRQIVGFLIFSGFLFFNSVYVWPKLFAAAFLFCVASLLLDRRRRGEPFTSFEIILVTTSLSLALMAHPGSVFSLPGLLLVAPCRRSLNLRNVVLALAILAAFILPWATYQKLYDPPGNRLLKMHLAGVIGIDARSTWTALRDAYTQPSPSQLALNKWSNVKEILGPKPLAVIPPLDFHADSRESTRIAQREYIWNAIGLANLGWLAGLAFLFRRKRTFPLTHAGRLIAIAAINLAIWCLVLYGPNNTFTTDSSYADLLLLSVGLLGFLLTLGRWMFLALFALQLLNVLVVWVWSIPARPHTTAELEWPFLIVGIGLTAALVWHFGRACWQPDLPRLATQDALPEHL